MLRKWMILLALLVISAPALAEGGKPRGDSSGANRVVTLHDLLGADDEPRRAVLSPDGQKIAWQQGDGLCIYTMDDAATHCSPMPDDFRDFAPALVWAANSSTLAFTQDFYIHFQEPDLYTYDLSQDRFANLTNDGTHDSLLKVGKNTPADTLPTWTPLDNLYWWRSYRTEQPSQSVYHMNFSKPEEIQNLTRLIPGPYSVYQQPAISPDGDVMAFLVRSASANDDPKNGVYTLNLKTGSVELIANIPALRRFTPSWVDEAKATPTAVYWSGANLVVDMKAFDFGTLEPANAIYIELPSKTLTPLFDYSRYTSKVDYAAAWSNGQTERAAILRSGIVSGDGKEYVFLHGLAGDKVGFSSLPLPPDGSTPVALGASDTKIGSPDPVSSISDDGKRVLIDGLLLTVRH